MPVPSAEWMYRLRPSAANPAMSDPPANCPANSARSNGMRTTSRHGFPAPSRTRITVAPEVVSNAVSPRITKSASGVQLNTSPVFSASSVSAPVARSAR